MATPVRALRTWGAEDAACQHVPLKSHEARDALCSGSALQAQHWPIEEKLANILDFSSMKLRMSMKNVEINHRLKEEQFGYFIYNMSK